MKNLGYFRFFLSFFIFSYIFLPTLALASQASLFFSDPPSQVEEGDRVTIYVRINSTAQSINAVSGAVSYPQDMLRVVSVSKEGKNSLMNIWTQEPKVLRDKILFEGVILNPGFQGNNGNIFQISFEAEQAGIAKIDFAEGAVLANDGLGSNVLATLIPQSIKIIKGQNNAFVNNVAVTKPEPTQNKIVALPVITEYTPFIFSKERLEIKGKGEPFSLTRIVFKDVAVKSLGEKFIAFLQTKKKRIDEVLVKNDDQGFFEYSSPENLVAGVYNATPFLVDEEVSVEKPGLGVQLFVNDNKIVKWLVVLINVLALLIPVVALIVIIYAIPWYSWRRMRLAKKKFGLEEEKLEITEHQLARQDKILDKKVEKLTKDEDLK